MAEEQSAISITSDESSHICGLREKRQGPLHTDLDGIATTSGIAREELGDYLGVQLAAITLTREQFNQGVRIQNAEVRADRHLSQVIEPIWRTAEVIDEYGNRRSNNIHMVSSDESSLSPPPTTDYGGSEVSFPSQTPRERVVSPLPTTNYSEGSLLGIPPSALPQDPVWTPRASIGIIARKYIQSEENASQHAAKHGGIEESRKVYTPIQRKFEISNSSNNEENMMTEVESRDETPYMTPTKKGKKRNKGKGVNRPIMPERPVPNMPQTPSRRKLEADWAKL